MNARVSLTESERSDFRLSDEWRCERCRSESEARRQPLAGRASDTSHRCAPLEGPLRCHSVSSPQCAAPLCVAPRRSASLALTSSRTAVAVQSLSHDYRGASRSRARSVLRALHERAINAASNGWPPTPSRDTPESDPRSSRQSSLTVAFMAWRFVSRRVSCKLL